MLYVGPTKNCTCIQYFNF